jgi:gliding motility associated protien GldN
MNHPLYFPTQPLGDRKNLVTLIVDVLQNPEPEHPVYAYTPTLRSTDYEFTAPLSTEDAIKGIADYTYVTYRDSITGQAVTDTTGFDVQTEMIKEVTRLYIKEKWFFDRRYSTLKVRIIGICPVKMVPETVDDPVTGLPSLTGNIYREPLFWIYYPEFRWYFSRNFIFNRNNDAQPISYDDLFVQRRFSSFIYKESNVYDNREIREYQHGLDQLFESERIKQEIFEYEHDLWEY